MLSSCSPVSSRRRRWNWDAAAAQLWPLEKVSAVNFRSGKGPKAAIILSHFTKRDWEYGHQPAVAPVLLPPDLLCWTGGTAAADRVQSQVGLQVQMFSSTLLLFQHRTLCMIHPGCPASWLCLHDPQLLLLLLSCCVWVLWVPGCPCRGMGMHANVLASCAEKCWAPGMSRGHWWSTEVPAKFGQKGR